MSHPEKSDPKRWRLRALDNLGPDGSWAPVGAKNEYLFSLFIAVWKKTIEYLKKIIIMESWHSLEKNLIYKYVKGYEVMTTQFSIRLDYYRFSGNLNKLWQAQ